MKHWTSSAPIVLSLFLATRAAAQTAPAPGATPPARAAQSGQSTQPSTEPPVEPPPDVAPGTGQPPPPPAPPDATKSGEVPSPGEVTTKWTMTLYGFAEFDIMRDSTQSFSDSPGNGLIARPDGAMPVAYRNGRTQTTARNSRVGVRLTAPESNGLRASGNVEMDFMGNQPGVSEAAFVNNGTFRIRAAYARVETDYVDVLAGQYYFLFGQQPFFFPMSIWFFGLPNQAFGRTQQLRLSHVFKSDAVNFDVGVAALRPPQRDSEMPDLQGAVKIGLNSWKGPHTVGSGYAAVDPLSISISGSRRRFRVNEFAATPMTTNTADGWGISIDAMIPVIPAASADHKENSLTLTGSFVIGEGIGDLLGGLTGGASFPSMPPAEKDGAPIPYPANIDNGLVQYDTDGNLRTLGWRTFMAGIQYYLPPSGKITMGANYTQGDSDDVTDDLTGAALSRVMKKSQFVELVALGDITPALRVGAAWQYLRQTLGDDMKTKNNRVELSVYYFF